MKLLLSQPPFWNSKISLIARAIAAQRSIPRISSLWLLSTPVQRHICLVVEFLFSKCHEYHHSHFPTGSCLQIKVHCLTSFGLILVTTTELRIVAFFPIDLCCLWTLSTWHFTIFDSSGNQHDAEQWCSVLWNNHACLSCEMPFVLNWENSSYLSHRLIIYNIIYNSWKVEEVHG